MKLASAVFAVLGLPGAFASPPRSRDLDASYTFDRYVADFSKPYRPGTDEWTKRERIFDRNLRAVLEHNAAYYGDDAGGRRPSHVLGLNALTDSDPTEYPTGYDKAGSSLRRQRRGGEGRRSPPDLVGTDGGIASERALRNDGNDHRKPLPFGVEPVSSLPPSVDWRTSGVVTPVKDQGMCGSCWAFASTAVLESHIAMSTGSLFDLSPQELVSCVPNPHHCGGRGGCTGSTAELAYDFVATDGNGIVQEYQMGYTSYRGNSGNCTIAGNYDEDGATATSLRGADAGGSPGLGGIKGAVASIEGYANVPSNNYTVLMNAIAKTGPVAVAVAASAWGPYEGGVFSVDMSKGGAATDLNHLVVLVGYGTDRKTGEDYWLIRNSWSPRWGEKGYIRLKRTDPAESGAECGTDDTPLDGMGCETDEDGEPADNKPFEVCGTSGVLYDAVLPVGGYLM